MVSSCIKKRRSTDMSSGAPIFSIMGKPLATGTAFLQACSSNSVRYFPASARAFALNSVCATSSSLGGGVARVATATPTSLKNSSCPAGEQMQSIRAGWEDEL